MFGHRVIAAEDPGGGSVTAAASTKCSKRFEVTLDGDPEAGAAQPQLDRLVADDEQMVVAPPFHQVDIAHRCELRHLGFVADEHLQNLWGLGRRRRLGAYRPCAGGNAERYARCNRRQRSTEMSSLHAYSCSYSKQPRGNRSQKKEPWRRLNMGYLAQSSIDIIDRRSPFLDGHQVR